MSGSERVPPVSGAPPWEPVSQSCLSGGATTEGPTVAQPLTEGPPAAQPTPRHGTKETTITTARSGTPGRPRVTNYGAYRSQRSQDDAGRDRGRQVQGAGTEGHMGHTGHRTKQAGTWDDRSHRQRQRVTEH